MLLYTKPTRCTPDRNWIKKTIYKISRNFEHIDEEDIVSKWSHGCYDICVIKIGQFLNWTATLNMKVVGAGEFHFNLNLVERYQAIFKRHQRKGIYSSVLDFMAEYAYPLNVENDNQQSVAMVNLWNKRGFTDYEMFELIDIVSNTNQDDTCITESNNQKNLEKNLKD